MLLFIHQTFSIFRSIFRSISIPLNRNVHPMRKQFWFFSNWTCIWNEIAMCCFMIHEEQLHYILSVSVFVTKIHLHQSFGQILQQYQSIASANFAMPKHMEMDKLLAFWLWFDDKRSHKMNKIKTHKINRYISCGFNSLTPPTS